MKDYIKKHVNILLEWIETNDYSSYDHYDFWSSKIGLMAKQVFSKNRILGTPLVLPIYFLDTYFPQTRKMFASKSKSSESIPRIASVYFLLYENTGNSVYLERGCTLLRWLQGNSSKTQHGIGWGLHFDWQAKEFIPKETPCVTLTAYSTKAFSEGYRLTGLEDYLEIVNKTVYFVEHDLNHREIGNTTSMSYTPIDHNYVINANSYAATILLESVKINRNLLREEMINRLVNYIITQQNPDGSWYYSDKSQTPEKANFIDSFHTCFVLENLFWIWKWNKDERLLKAIDKGYNFFVKNFIQEDFSIRYYYYYPVYTGITVDMRGCAEAIHCCAVLSDIYPDALDLSMKIAEWSIKNMMDVEGFFYFRIYGTKKNRFPYIRWVQTPMLNALTYLFTKIKY